MQAEGEREIGLRQMKRHYVRKFGDAVNSGQAMRCRDINVVWSSLLTRCGEIYFAGTVTRCSRICRMYVCVYSTAINYVTLSRLYPST